MSPAVAESTTTLPSISNSESAVKGAVISARRYSSSVRAATDAFKSAQFDTLTVFSVSAATSSAASAAVGHSPRIRLNVNNHDNTFLFTSNPRFSTNLLSIISDTASSRGRSSASSSFRRPRPDGRSHGCSWPPVRRDSASRTACCPAALPCCPAGRFRSAAYGRARG